MTFSLTLLVKGKMSSRHFKHYLLEGGKIIMEDRSPVLVAKRRSLGNAIKCIRLRLISRLYCLRVFLLSVMIEELIALSSLHRISI